MFLINWRKWLNDAFRPRKKTHRRDGRSPHFKPECLLLEDRLAPANFYTVTGFTDGPSASAGGNGTAGAPFQYATLRGAVIAADTFDGGGGTSTITLPAGAYQLTRIGNTAGGANPNDFDPTVGDLNVDNSGLTINGAGSGTGTSDTIIQQNTTNDRVFDVNENFLNTFNFTIKNLTIEGGRDTAGNSTAGASGGGAIFAGAQVSGTTDVENVEFLNNQSTGSGSIEGEGGAILLEGGNLTVNGCTFGDGTSANANTTSGTGGAIAYDSFGTTGTLKVTNSTFNDNLANGTSGSAGGAISITQTDFGSNPSVATANISGSNFTANSSTAGDGGAIFLESGTLNVTTSNFLNNTVKGTGQGGAIDAQGGNTVAVTYSRFVGNTAAATNAGNTLSFGTGGDIVLTGNTNGTKTVQMPNTAGLAVGMMVTGTGIPVGTTISQIILNTSVTLTQSATSSMNNVSLTFTDSFSANDNWWGTNGGPASSAFASDAGSAAIIHTVWLELRNIASTSPININQSTTVTADLYGLNSPTGGTAPAGSLNGLPAFPVPAATIFSSPHLGSLSSPSTQFVNGVATVSFTGTAGGTGSVAATADSQTITADITINAPTTVTSINRTTPTGPSTNASSVTYTVTFANATLGLTASNLHLTGTAGVADANIGTISTTDAGLIWSVIVNGLASANGTLILNLVNSTGLDHMPTNLPFAGQTYTLDTTAPTAALTTAPPAFINQTAAGTKTTTLTVTYADSGTGINTSTFGTANISVNHGATVTGFTANGNAITYTITAPAATWGAGFQGAYTVSLNASVKDNVGNAVATNGNLASFVVDTVVPTASLTTAPPNLKSSSAAATTTTLTVTYADGGSGIDTTTFSTANISVNHGATVTGFTPNGNAVTYTITAPAATWGASFQGTYTVSLIAASVKDKAGNPVAANANLATFVVDTVVPTASLTTAPPAFINNTSAGTNTTTLTVTYADSESGIDTTTFGTANISVNNGATVTGFMPNGNAVTYTITAPAANWGSGFQGTYTVSLNASVGDLNGNAVAANAALASFVVDTGAPTASLTTAPPAFINTTSAATSTTTLTVTYADSVSGLDTSTFGTANISVNNGATVTGFTPNGNAVTYTITAPAATWGASFQGAYTVGLNASVKDKAGNPVGANATLATFVVDTVVPTASLTTAPPNLNSSSAAATTTTLTVTYADSGSGIDTTTFGTANISVNNGATVTGFAPSSNAVTYTISAPNANWGSSFQGTYAVSLNAASVKDKAGNSVAANANLASFTVGSADPTATLTTPPPAYLNASAANTNTTTLTVTYTAAAPATINTATIGTANISVDHGAIVTSFAAIGNVVTYTITELAATNWGSSFQGTYTVSLNASVEDNLGNPVASIADFGSFVVDTLAPTASLTTAPPAFINATSAATSTTTLTVTYADSGTGIDTSTFGTANLSVNNGATVTGFSPNGNAVTYTITAPAATWGASSSQGAYTVGLNASVMDLAGNPVAANAALTSFVVDTVAPSIVINGPTTSLVGGAYQISYTINYADTNFSHSTLTVGNVTLDHSGSATATITVDSGTGATRTVTLTNVSGTGTLGISIAAGTAVDTAGNLAPAAGPSATVSVAPPTITSLSNAAFTAKSPVNFQLTANGTPSQMSFSLVGAPSWLSINSSNQLVGTPPANAGNTVYHVPQFTIKAHNGVASDGSQAFNLTINPAMTFKPASLPAITVGQNYSQSITVSGGTGTVTVTYTLSGPLPPGLSISPPSPTTGAITISGKPTATGSVTITLEAIDSVGAETVITYTLTGTLGPKRRGL